MTATLYLICGMVCAGKTTLARRLEATLPAVRLSPDEWIKAVIADGDDREEADRVRDSVEALQWSMAQKLMELGTSVILENGFWSREERGAYRQRAKALGARVVLHYLDVPKAELQRRILWRNEHGPVESFKVSVEELDGWLALFTPPDADELATYDDCEVHRPFTKEMT